MTTRKAQLRLATTALSAALVMSLAAPAHAADRVKIDGDNNVVTQFDTPLRGAPFFMDIFGIKRDGGMAKNLATYEAYFNEAVQTYELNAVRCSPWVGKHAFFAFDQYQADHRTQFDILLDNCVQWAENNDIYAIVNYHTEFRTVLQPDLVKGFWDIYAPRYRNKSHVVFELVNEPEINSAKREMQGLYDHVRALAPDTHLILWSVFDPLEITADEIKAATPRINYRRDNASVGWHNYYDVTDTRAWDRADSFADAGLPIINTEFWSLADRNDFPISYGSIADNVRIAEERGHSWMLWAPYLNYQFPNKGISHDRVKFSPTFETAVRDGARTIATQASGLKNNVFASGLGGQYWTKWGDSVNGGEPQTPAQSNTVGFGTVPGQVGLDGRFTVTGNYEATGRRDIVLEIFNQTTGRWLGQSKKTVDGGKGSVTITADVGSIPAGKYRVKLGIRNVGADWRNTYQDIYRDNVMASGGSSGGGGGRNKPTIFLNAADADAVSGGVIRYNGAGVGNFGPGAWVKFNRVDLGKDGYSRIRARISTAGSGQLEVRAQRLDGPVLATIDFSGNSYDFSDGIWRESSFPAWEYPQVLYFRMKSGWANLGDIQLIDN